MKKNSLCVSGRYLSAEKVQDLFTNLGLEISSGRKRIRASRSENAIVIHVNGGTVNITFNEKGGEV